MIYHEIQSVINSPYYLPHFYLIDVVAALGFRIYAQYLSLKGDKPNQCTRASVQPTIPLGILKVKLSEKY